MKKFKRILILLILCLLPIKVHASCTSEERARLKKMVSNINVSYDYQMIGGNPIFSIRFSNLNPELYFMDPFENYYQVYDLENNEIVLNNYADGKSYTFNFYGGINACGGINVGRLYVTTPTYNPYYQLTVCDDAREYDLCQKWVSHSLSKNEFVDKVNEYKEKKGIIDNSEVKKKISFIDLAFSFLRMYGLYIVIGIVIIIIVIKVIRYKKDTFGF